MPIVHEQRLKRHGGRRSVAIHDARVGIVEQGEDVVQVVANDRQVE